MPEPIFFQEYNRQDFMPPMPVLNIGISKSGLNTPFAMVEAIVDTGADGTLLPRDILERAGAPYVDRAYLRGITGERQPVDLYVVTLHLGERRIHGVRAVALSAEATAILGRDVLTRCISALSARPM